MQKKAAVIQDISCFGKCSAAVALPILAHFDIETALLPTALLSAHTAFPTYSCLDLTNVMKQNAADWKQLGLTFDGIYSGYMLGAEQIELTSDFIDGFAKKDAVVLVDPVMGDDAKAYSLLSGQSAESMARLAAKATVITPNLTEAAMLLDKEAVLSGYDEGYIRGLLFDLKKLGCACPVITGVSFNENEIGAAYLAGGEMKYLSSEKYDGSFSGTGDVFASVLFSVLMCGGAVESGIKKALSVLDTAIRESDVTYGIAFEKALKLMN